MNKARLKTGFLYLVLSSWQQSLTNADPTQDWVKSHSDFFQHTPKLWFAYVESILYQHQSNDFEGGCGTIPINIKSQFLFVDCFKKRNLSLLFHEDVQKENRGDSPLDLSTRTSNIRKLYFNREVLWPEGNIYLNSDSLLPSALLYHQYCKNGFTILDDCKNVYHRRAWGWARSEIFARFQLSEKLTGNFTFTHLEFISGSVNFVGGQVSCKFGAVDIVPVNQTIDLQFCGFLSDFSVFPQFNNIDLKVSAFPSTVFHVVVAYTVLDSGVITTLNSSQALNKNITNIASFAYMDFDDEHKLEIVEIVVQKTEKVILLFDQKQCHQTQILVLDGPGYLSHRSIMRYNVSFLSSFTALLSVFNGCSMEMNEFGFRYKTNPAMIRPLRIVQSITETLPNLFGNFGEQVSVLFAYAPGNKTVNLSINILQYSGVASESCKFGGFVTAEYLREGYSENSILCKTSISKEETFERNFYSSNSSLLALLYMFSPYSSIRATFTLSLSDCKFINICPCVINRYPMCEFALDNNLQCASYRDFQRKHQGIKLFFVPRDELWTLPIQPGMCFALNIARREICSQNDQRVMPYLGFYNALRIFKYFSDKFNLDVTVRGVLQQPLTNKSQWRNCMFKCGYPSEVIVDPKTICIQKSTDMTHFYVVKEFPVDLVLELLEPLHAQNWLEIVVRTKPQSADVRPQLLGDVHHTTQVVHNGLQAFLLQKTLP